jgi:hypothetical protein
MGHLLMNNDMKFSLFFWCGELTPQVFASIILQPAYIVLYLPAENISKNPFV